MYGGLFGDQSLHPHLQAAAASHLHEEAPPLCFSTAQEYNIWIESAEVEKSLLVFSILKVRIFFHTVNTFLLKHIFFNKKKGEFCIYKLSE